MYTQLESLLRSISIFNQVKLVVVRHLPFIYVVAFEHIMIINDFHQSSIKQSTMNQPAMSLKKEAIRTHLHSLSLINQEIILANKWSREVSSIGMNGKTLCCNWITDDGQQMETISITRWIETMIPSPGTSTYNIDAIFQRTERVLPERMRENKFQTYVFAQFFTVSSQQVALNFQTLLRQYKRADGGSFYWIVESLYVRIKDKICSERFNGNFCLSQYKLVVITVSFVNQLITLTSLAKRL